MTWQNEGGDGRTGPWPSPGGNQPPPHGQQPPAGQPPSPTQPPPHDQQPYPSQAHPAPGQPPYPSQAHPAPGQPPYPSQQGYPAPGGYPPGPTGQGWPGQPGIPPAPPPPWGAQGAYGSPRYPPNGQSTTDPVRSGPPPLGNQPLRPVDIQSYAAPKLTRSWIVWLLAAAVLAGIVLGATFLNRPPASAPGGAPSSPASGPTSSGPGLPFTMPYNPEAGGRWEVLAQEWTTGGVVLRVRLFADRGTITYGFLAFENNGVDVVRPDTSPKSPELTRGSMTAGETETGYVFIPIERGPATLILTTSGGRQISALPIAG